MDATPFPAELSLRLTIAPDDPVGGLEGALAIVRRGGIALAGLRAGLGTHGLEVWMCLGAADEDTLRLCLVRLRNAVGIGELEEMPGRHAPVPARLPAVCAAA